MDEGVRIDLRLLRDYMSAVLKEKRLAQELYSKVEGVSRFSDDSSRLQYRKILSRIENLIHFYQRLGETLQGVEENTIAIHREIMTRLREETDEGKRVLPNACL